MPSNNDRPLAATNDLTRYLIRRTIAFTLYNILLVLSMVYIAYLAIL